MSNSYSCKLELLKKRDLHYHERRRIYGALSALDFDMIDYNYKKMPVLVQELKHCKISTIYLSDLEGPINSANLMQCPFVLTVYYFLRHKGKSLVAIHAGETFPIDHIQYWCYPLNKLALYFLPKEGKYMTEYEYITMLHEARGMSVPKADDNFFQHIEEGSVDCFIPEIK